MQQSTTMAKLGPVWAVIQFLWSIKRIVAIVSMLTALVYLLASETLEQRRTMLAEFAKADSIVADLEADFKALGDEAFSGPSRDGRSVTPDLGSRLYKATQALRSELASLSPPTNAIEHALIRYTASLSDLQGSLNLFEPGAEGTISVLRALDAVEEPAADYRLAATKYERSVWRSFWAAF